MEELIQADVRIAYIGGGSRGWAWTLMSDLAHEKRISGTVLLYDLDFEASVQNQRIAERINANPKVESRWKYEAVPTLESALSGADFVILSILPGTFEEMNSDVHAPEKYGIYQAVGDTTGPGGLIRALRTIPMYVEIAEHIKKYAPNAWVINYTNPMALCVRTLYAIFPGVKAIGCCHEVMNVQRVLGKMLQTMKGISGVSKDEIKVNLLGINHFTWIDQASYRNVDLMPLYAEYAERGPPSVRFDLFKRYGLIAAAGDSHLAEFLPREWYLKSPETIKKWGFRMKGVDWRAERRRALIEKSKQYVEGQQEIEIARSDEEAPQIMLALLGLEDFTTNVNFPNLGQMVDLPKRVVLETIAHISYDSVRPLIAGRLPIAISNLVSRHVMNQETILQAALTRDKELAFKAFLNDPLVGIEPAAAERLFHEMLDNTAKYLCGWNH